jgi:hypothetical protein
VLPPFDLERIFEREMVDNSRFYLAVAFLSMLSGSVHANQISYSSTPDTELPPYNVAQNASGERDVDVRIRVKYLSNEATNPYLVYGEPPRSHSVIAKRGHFDSVKACLTKSERDKTRPPTD